MTQTKTISVEDKVADVLELHHSFISKKLAIELLQEILTETRGTTDREFVRRHISALQGRR